MEISSLGWRQDKIWPQNLQELRHKKYRKTQIDSEQIIIYLLTNYKGQANYLFYIVLYSSALFALLECSLTLSSASAPYPPPFPIWDVSDTFHRRPGYDTIRWQRGPIRWPMTMTMTISRYPMTILPALSCTAQPVSRHANSKHMVKSLSCRLD